MNCDIGETRVSTHRSVNTALKQEPHSLQEISHKTERLEIIAELVSGQTEKHHLRRSFT